MSSALLPPTSLTCAHPLTGLCFFRFHFPEGSNVKIVEFYFFESYFHSPFKWSSGRRELTFILFSYELRLCSQRKSSYFSYKRIKTAYVYGEPFAVTFGQGKFAFRSRPFNNVSPMKANTFITRSRSRRLSAFSFKTWPPETLCCKSMLELFI